MTAINDASGSRSFPIKQRGWRRAVSLTARLLIGVVVIVAIVAGILVKRQMRHRAWLREAEVSCLRDDGRSLGSAGADAPPLRHPHKLLFL